MQVKKLLSFAILSLFSLSMFSQSSSRADFKNIFGGGTFQLQYGVMIGTSSDLFVGEQDRELIHVITDTPLFKEFGLSMGIDLRGKLSQALSLRLQPSLHLTRQLYNISVYNELRPVKIDRNFVSLPLHLMVHGKKDRRLYAFLGGRWTYDLSVDNEILLLPYNTGVFFPFKKHNLSADLGMGYKISTRRFTVAPELTFSAGMLDQVGSSDYLSDDKAHGYTHRLMFSIVIN